MSRPTNGLQTAYKRPTNGQLKVKIRKACPPSLCACPDCQGSLWELEEGNITEFACFEGHVYSAAGLLAGKEQVLENAPWIAARALDERAKVFRHVARRFTVKKLVEAYDVKARELEKSAKILKELLKRLP